MKSEGKHDLDTFAKPRLQKNQKKGKKVKVEIKTETSTEEKAME